MSLTRSQFTIAQLFLRAYVPRLLFLILLGAVSFVAPHTVQALSVGEEAVALKDELAISNFGQVSNTLWRGSLPSDASLEKLAKHGVKTVIDLRYDGSGRKHEAVAAAKLGLQYVHMPIGFGKLTVSEVISFLKIMSEPKNLPVYVHCRQGADRTGVLVASYRMLVQNWTFDKTYNEMRFYHFKPWLLA